MIDGGPPAQYMGMPDMKAQHITLALEGAEPRFEIQLLEFAPTPPDDPGEHPTNLRRRGYNHLAFRVDDIEAVTTHLVANGVKMLSDEMDYISRRLRLFEGPEGITLELVQWVDVRQRPRVTPETSAAPICPSRDELEESASTSLTHRTSVRANTADLDELIEVHRRRPGRSRTRRGQAGAPVRITPDRRLRRRAPPPTLPSLIEPPFADARRRFHCQIRVAAQLCSWAATRGCQ